MLRRIQIYAFGFFLGSIVVYVTLIRDRDRDLGSWLPENRVKAEIKEKFYASQNECMLNCFDIDSLGFIDMIDEGDVVFSESDVSAVPRSYAFHRNDEIWLVKVDDDSARLGVPEKGVKCPCP
jgi:hypothetical protein